ncbi:MAG: phage holin family protein [Ferruginibacter sp.]
MLQQSENIEGLFEKAKDYVETRLELFKLKTALTTSEVVAELVGRIVLILFITIVVVLLNIGMALWLGEVLGKNYYGFLILAGFYSLLSVILYIFRKKWIKSPVSNAIIKKMTRP